MRRLSPLLCLLLTASAAAPAPSDVAVGRTTPLRWKNGAQAAISVTMDDGYASQWRFMSSLLASRGFAGTFFIVTGWVDSEDHWARWKEVADAGHEIGSHGMTHKPLSGMKPSQLAAELEGSRRRIQERLGAAHGRTLAYPQSTATPELASAAARAGYDAARTGGIAYTPPTPDDFHRIPSLHPLTSTPLWEMNSWVDDIREKGGWLVVGVHGIADPDAPVSPTQEGWEAIPVERYVAFVDHMAAAGNEVWVAPFGQVARYIRGRDAVRASTRSVSADALQISLNGPPGGTELTFETTVPASWAEVTVTGGRKDDQAPRPTRPEKGARVVRFSAAPPASVVIRPTALAIPAR
ncbi:MAG: polysaccharide deacetylase family protein [Candidatus Polarisedimenticolia bacterium]